MRNLIEQLDSFLEAKAAKFTGGIGTFGGKQHKWPEKAVSGRGYKDWTLTWVGKRDKFGDAWEVLFTHEGETGGSIEFDAGAWLKSSGKKPIKYKIESYGVEKKGTIKSPDEVLGMMDEAAKITKKAKAKMFASAPKRKGWELSKSENSLYYSHEVVMKYGMGLTVNVEDDAYLGAYSGGEGVATIDLDSDKDKETKHVDIKGMADIEDVLIEAEDMLEEADYQVEL